MGKEYSTLISNPTYKPQNGNKPINRNLKKKWWELKKYLIQIFPAKHFRKLTSAASEKHPTKESKEMKEKGKPTVTHI